MNWMRTDLGRSNRQRTLHANRCKRSHISFANLALRTAADVASHLSTDLSVEAAQRTICAPLRISNQPPTAAAMRQLESSSSQQAACRSNRPIGGQGSSLVPRSNTVTKWTLDSGHPGCPLASFPGRSRLQFSIAPVAPSVHVHVYARPVFQNSTPF